MNRLWKVSRPIVAVLLTAFLLVNASAFAADDEEEIDIAGEYSCQGGGDRGGVYSGKVTITKTGETYRVQWKIASGEAHVGVAIREGNVLSVCFVGQRVAGVVSYKIDKDKHGPRLVGRWAGVGDKKTQSETLTRGPLPSPAKQQTPSFTSNKAGLRKLTTSPSAT